MANTDLLLQLVIRAVDLATEDLEEVNAKVKELGRTLTQSSFTTAGEDMRAFGDAVKAATDPLAQATVKTLALQTAITGLASVFANKAYQSSKNYESALADLAKVLDGGMDAAKGYGARLNETASQFAQNGQELVSAMANFVQAGYNAEEAFALVTDSTKLMIAGELDAARSSELLTSILKGFKAPASEAGAAVDLLNDVSNKYATNVEQLAVGMAALSPIAQQMGFSMTETAGLLTPIIEVYRSGSEAADALKTSLQQLSANTAPVKAALASIGVAQTDMNGKLRDGKDIFLDVARAFLTLSDAQKGYFSQELVGIEQAGRFGQTINNLGQYLKIAADDTDRAGSAMREVTARLDTAEAAAQRADESFRQLAVSLGNAFKPQIRGVVEATGGLAAAFDRSIKAGDLAPLLNVIKPQIAAIETLFQAMAGNLEEALGSVDWRPLVDGLKAVSGELGDAFGKLTEGMDLTTVEGLRNLLQALINLLGNFSQFVAGAVDGLEPLLGALNTLFGAVSQNSPALANLAGEIAGLATSANQIVPVVSAFGSAIFGAIGNIAELALKIGLLVVAMKLLSAAGIPVLGILGRLTAAFFALNPAVASAAAALAGFPGIVTALVAGAGALGYGIGTLLNQFVEWATGGRSVGSMLADLVDAVTGLNQEITRGATPEELAIARAQRLTREREAQAKATAEAAKAEAEANAKREEGLQKQGKKLELNAADEETTRRLTAAFAEQGLVYDATTGQILRQGQATAQQLQKARELGDALDKLGVNANVMADRITANGQEIIATFRAITQNAQATSAQIEAAFKAAVASAETEAEVKAILKAYQGWAVGANRTAEEINAAFSKAIDSDKTNQEVDKILKKVQEWAILTKADAARIKAAFDQAISSAKTKEEVEKIKDAYQAWAAMTKITAADVAGATALADNKIKALKKSTEELTLAQKMGIPSVQELADTLRKQAEASLFKSASSQENTQQTEQNTQTTQENTAAQQENIKVIDSSRESLQRTNAIIADTRAQMAALSETTKRYYDVQFTQALEQVGMEGAFEANRKAMANFNADLSASSQKLADYAEAFNAAVALEQQGLERMAFAMNGFAKIDAAVEIASGRAQQAYYQQAAAAERLRVSIETMSISNVTAASQIEQAARRAENGFKFLDEEDLSGLRQAISDASNRLRELQNETQTAQERLAALNAEIAAERGDTATSDRLKLELEQQQAVRDVEAKLAEARAQQNRELIQLYAAQLQKLQELYRLKEKNLEQDIEEKKAAAQQTANLESGGSGGGTGSGGRNTSSSSAGGGVTLNVNANNARLLDSKFVEDLTRQIVPVLNSVNRRLA